MSEPFHPAVAFCEEKNRLQEALLTAIRQLNVLLTQQTQALIAGDPEFNRFDVLLHMSQERKDTAKYALMAHIETHGCGV